jgi:4'-phosphopantetheinyl transferase
VTTGSHWAPAPAVVRAGPGVVDVWRADLAVASSSYRDLLSRDELERVERFIRTTHGGWWASARGILRALLARYLDTDPRALRFTAGAHGKPALAEPATTLRFNMSHAGPAALYAVTDGSEVGVDLEREDRRVDPVRVARRIFGADEAARLGALDPPARQREFLREWVRHEALVKCLGTGIGAYRAGPQLTDRPSVCELDVGPGSVAAVAIAVAKERPEVELRHWEWPTAQPS